MRIDFNMRPTLPGSRRGGFSKTAWSGPGHGEARGHGSGYAAAAIGARRFAHDLAERSTERAQAGEADVEADVGHAPGRLAQQEHRALDTAALQVAVRGLAERRVERADEVRLGYDRDPRQRGKVERLGVGAVHRVAGAKHPPIAVLHRLAH